MREVEEAWQKTAFKEAALRREAWRLERETLWSARRLKCEAIREALTKEGCDLGQELFSGVGLSKVSLYKGTSPIRKRPPP